MKKRNYAIDFIKAFSILAVVIIHVSTAFLDKTIPFTYSFDILLFINQFSRFAVPLFFASSGFLLASKYHAHINTTTFYKKRLVRIFPSYIFWFFLYYFIIFPHSLDSSMSYAFIISFLTGNASYQLYFIPAIIILYFLFPFFTRFKSVFLSTKFLLMLFICMSFFLTFIYYGNYHLPLFSPLRGALYNVFPFLMGMWAVIHQHRLSKFMRNYFPVLAILTTSLGIIIFSESFFLLKHFSEMRFIRDQWRISVVIYGLLCGATGIKVYEKFFSKWNAQVLLVSHLSFGVFFIHVAILKYFLLYIVSPLQLYSLHGFFFTLTNVALISFVIIYLMSKIPKIGRVMSAT